MAVVYKPTQNVVLWFSTFFQAKKKKKTTQCSVSYLSDWGGELFLHGTGAGGSQLSANCVGWSSFMAKGKSWVYSVRRAPTIQASCESYWSPLATEPPWNVFAIYFQSDFMLRLHIWIFLHQPSNNLMKDLGVIWFCCEESIKAEPIIVEP